MKPILVTTGAIKNAGDYLIHDRGLRLLATALDDRDLVSVPRWQAVESALFDRSGGVVACGGPGLRPGLLETYVPLAQALRSGLPCSILGGGWGSSDARMLDEASVEAVGGILSRGGLVTVRDPISQQRLVDTTGHRAIMTGCPAWYFVATLDAALHHPTEFRSIAFTTPASARFAVQAERVLKALTDRFPNASRTVVLHRGRPTVARPSLTVAGLWRTGSAMRHRARVTRMEVVARRSGWQIVDASFDLSKLDLYAEIDMHVGYRVHAHLDALSLRRPSILIAEDVRGLGQFAALNDVYALSAHQHDVNDIMRAVDAEAETLASSGLAVQRMKLTWPTMRQALADIGGSFAES